MWANWGKKNKYLKNHNFGTTQMINIKLVSLKSDVQDLCKHISLIVDCWFTKSLWTTYCKALTSNSPKQFTPKVPVLILLSLSKSKSPPFVIWCYLEFHWISAKCHYLSEDVTKKLLCVFLLLRLDYCNSLLVGCQAPIYF